MYAQRYADGPRFRPASLSAAIAINGAFVTALLLANPEWAPNIPEPPIQIIDILPEKPKPLPTEEPRVAKPRPQPTATVVTPKPDIRPIDPSPNVLTGDDVIGNPTGPLSGAGNDIIDGPITPPIPPLFVAAREDPRFLADFQPAYPDFERDAGREDLVKLRIRIGIDGRVKQVERLGGRDSFARAAIAHALAKWRFKPATRGGVPEESWKVMTVRFTLNS